MEVASFGLLIEADVLKAAVESTVIAAILSIKGILRDREASPDLIRRLCFNLSSAIID